DQADEFHSIRAKSLYMLAYDTVFRPIVEPINDQIGMRLLNENDIKNEEIVLEIDAIAVSPNPATNHATISYEINTVKGQGLIEMRNVLGQLVFSTAITTEKGNVNVDTSKLTDGIYFINISVNGVQTAQKKLLLIK
ncbi:MAG: T9SS type A sorting domain-containing protein, partial [Bacteroidetes bacterium]|nr:T9SS type A sorting domain-containing protein [Bacteroidota bacterium]